MSADDRFTTTYTHHRATSQMCYYYRDGPDHIKLFNVNDGNVAEGLTSLYVSLRSL